MLLTKSVADRRPLILHVVHRFDVGGLENGIVNLINHMPEGTYRHAVVALTEVAEDFAQRIARADVPFYAMHKMPGQGLWIYPQMVSLLRALSPDIVHTRNLAPLEMSVPAWLARVPVRIHGEHGRDVEDLDGSSRRYQWIRRIYRPFVNHYVSLSKDLSGYLINRVGVSPENITQIYNGVNTERFRPAINSDSVSGCPFSVQQHWIIGTVGRMMPVKDQLTLARSFIRALKRQPALRDRLRLVMVGEGPLREVARVELDGAGVGDLCWLPGGRSDIPNVMRCFNCFVLPSLAEGVSNTILEAMATGLPVVATGVGGNGEIVTAQTGEIVLAANPDAMAESLLRLANDPDRASKLGVAGRREVESRFSLTAMVAAYIELYDRLLRSVQSTPVAGSKL